SAPRQLDGPLPAIGPLAERHAGRNRIARRLALHEAARRCEVRASSEADVGFAGRSLSGRSRARTPGLFLRHTVTRIAPSLGEQFADSRLRLTGPAFTEMVVTDAAVGVGEVVSGPILVLEGSPDRVVAVDGDRVGDAEVADRLADVGGIAFEGEFRRVH